MEEPTIVESKRQKKVPPPRPPPPSLLKKAGQSPPADPIPRSHTVSGDIIQRPKHSPVRHGGSPVPEKKSGFDPVPPPRRKKKQRSVFPEDNPNADVKEGFVDTKHDSSPPDSGNVTVDDYRLEMKERSASGSGSVSIGDGRQSVKRKEAQKLAKVKVNDLVMYVCYHKYTACMYAVAS